MLRIGLRIAAKAWPKSFAIVERFERKCRSNVGAPSVKWDIPRDRRKRPAHAGSLPAYAANPSPPTPDTFKRTPEDFKRTPDRHIRLSLRIPSHRRPWQFFA